MKIRTGRRFFALLLSGFIVATCGLVTWVVGWRWFGRGLETPSSDLQAVPSKTNDNTALETRIRAFCGDCHALPRPESFPRDAWPAEVEKAYRKYEDSGRTDLDPPLLGQTIEFYRSRAPEVLSYPEPKEAERPFRAKFQPETFELDAEQTGPSAIAGLCWTSLGSTNSASPSRVAGKASDSHRSSGESNTRTDSPDQQTEGRPVLVASDMFSGRVVALDLASPRRPVRLLVQMNHPCHVEPCDLDGDGATDLLIADLGSYDVRDHDLGRVVWLRQDKQMGRFAEHVLASGLGRVADARPIPLDTNGTFGIVVAEFGYFRTGSVLLLTNAAPPGKPMHFEPRVLDPRAGAIHVPVCDLDGDGLADFLALISNESECVEAFLQRGQGQFHRQTLWRGPDLSFGSSGIELVDLDGDGDLDVLYTNGDSFDNMYVTPWHGLQWLENLGGVRFKYHRLTDMSGACVARAGDFDDDGDLDILTVAFLPTALKPQWLAEQPLPSIVLLEQTSPRKFVRHTLEKGFPCHAAIVVADFNRDGRLDFAVGNHAGGHRAKELGRTWLTVWWNRGPPL